MSGPSSFQPQNPVIKWIERRLPIFGLVHSSFVAYPTPRNLNYWWTFGGILSFMLAVQIVTGVILAMHYTPEATMAFNSVEAIVRDVDYGWLLRYLHSNGASMFFIAVYVHMLRGLYYGSYKEPREVLWILGVIIYLLMMATGFMGYVLPWGQMSFWGATVITNLFSAIPYFGESIVTLLWGGYSVGNPTLNRFFSLHYLLPFVIAGVVVLHVWALHVAGQNNPAGVEPKTAKDTVPFTPYATTKDAFGLSCFILFYCWFVFYIPNYLGDPDNYIPANPGVTPAHIVPEWYYLPFYAILRSIPNKLAGVVAMFSAILVLAFLPWLDSAKTRSVRYRPLAKQFFWIFVAVCLGLGYLGAQPPEGIYVIVGRILTVCYFAYFLIVLPTLSRIEKPRTVPNSIADDVLGKKRYVASALAVLAAVGLLALDSGSTARAAEGHGPPAPSSLSWSFAGPFGKFDQGQLQRGYKVYKDVCASCHSMNLLHYRNLADPGGPGFSIAQAEALASEIQVKDGPNDAGDMFERPGRLADRLPAPFPNENAARAANGGAAPPDLSLMAKARGYERGFPQFIFDAFTQFQEKGPNYIYALLTGFKDEPPKGFALPEGSFYNQYFPGHAIKMPNPLSDDQVTYDDGTPQKVDQYAKDVSAFLMWAAEPKLEERKRIGLQVMIFMLVFAGLLYFTKKAVWADAH
ncbi:cytochrome c1 [Nitrobacter hamburgensis X14]|uniref:Cytochrome b n=1 Tax=Nitrobacter hamburgensis (strain DSM 10229 / NCIMB 13809 / X14) TaxID=323097 RepID=Q1QIH2_NITHX|nr:cytochrome c1 [Nitrobacter hamburgensis]ABE63975.1 cytochrome c1 [Nitrobacter hamburgensis X14]